MTGAHESARDRIRRLLDHGHLDNPTAFTEPLAEPFALDPPDGWLWDGSDPHPSTAFGLRDPQAYAHLAAGYTGKKIWIRS